MHWLRCLSIGETVKTRLRARDVVDLNLGRLLREAVRHRNGCSLPTRLVEKSSIAKPEPMAARDRSSDLSDGQGKDDDHREAIVERDLTPSAAHQWRWHGEALGCSIAKS